MALTRITLEPDLVERVYDALLHSITEGTLAAGARLAQEDLAAQLNVSRQPVLQALRLLKKDGFVIDAHSIARAFNSGYAMRLRRTFSRKTPRSNSPSSTPTE